MQRSILVVGGGVLALLVSACNPAASAGSDEEDAPSAEPAQVSPWRYGYRQYDFTFENDAPLASILVIGNSDMGSYLARTEYWYVETSSLQYLGSEDLEVEHVDGTGTPPSLTGDQEFTQPVFPTWNSFTSDPVDAGHLYGGAQAHLRIKTDAGEILRVTWYQTVDHDGDPKNVTPDGTYTVSSGSVPIPSGDDGYYIDATIE